MPKGIIPAVPEVARETIVVIAGAICAAGIMGMFPELPAWIKKQWQGANKPADIVKK